MEVTRERAAEAEATMEATEVHTVRTALALRKAPGMPQDKGEPGPTALQGRGPVVVAEVVAELLVAVAVHAPTTAFRIPGAEAEGRPSFQQARL